MKILYRLVGGAVARPSIFARYGLNLFSHGYHGPVISQLCSSKENSKRWESGGMKQCIRVMTSLLIKASRRVT